MLFAWMSKETFILQTILIEVIIIYLLQIEAMVTKR